MGSSRVMRRIVLALGAALTSACLNPVKLAAPLLKEPRPVHVKVEDPVRTDARLAVLWVGHATTLIQIDDKLILTDPVFTSAVGQMSKRLVEPGIDVDNVRWWTRR